MHWQPSPTPSPRAGLANASPALATPLHSPPQYRGCSILGRLRLRLWWPQAATATGSGTLREQLEVPGSACTNASASGSSCIAGMPASPPSESGRGRRLARIRQQRLGHTGTGSPGQRTWDCQCRWQGSTRRTLKLRLAWTLVVLLHLGHLLEHTNAQATCASGWLLFSDTSGW